MEHGSAGPDRPAAAPTSGPKPNKSGNQDFQAAILAACWLEAELLQAPLPLDRFPAEFDE